jgi:hypothetical protein
MKAISLYDFDSEEEAQVREHAFDYSLEGVLIRIRRADLDPAKLWAPSKVAENRNGLIAVPYIEAIYLGSIPQTAFDGHIVRKAE